MSDVASTPADAAGSKAASAAATPSPAAAAGTAGAVDGATAAGTASALPGEDHWLQTAQEYAGKCGCWGQLLSHSLDWAREQPTRAESWSYLGVAQLRNWHFEDALADEYYHSNRFAEAVASYQQALALEPGSAGLKEALARTKQR